MARPYVPERGDVVWLRFDPQAGREHAGRRPALVLSPKVYNQKVGLALFCPITTRIKGYPFEVALPVRAKLEGVILSDQVKSLDWRARSATKHTRVPKEVMRDVTKRVLALVEPD